MVWAVLLRVALLVGLSLPVWANAATYYLDITGGNDANAGTSTGTAWKHIRGMPTATGTAAAHTPVAGNTYVFKGGETWGTTNFPITWAWSGSAGNVITLGVDASWFTGASWARPIWDGADTVTSVGTAGGTMYATWWCDFFSTSCAYVTLSNIEMTRFRWSGAPSAGFCSQVNLWGTSHVTVDQVYIHDWTHGSATGDCGVVIGYSGNDTASTVQNSVIDGSRDTSGTIGSGSISYVNNIRNNFMTKLSGFSLPSGSSVTDGNTFTSCIHSFVSTDHNNWVESLGLGTPVSAFNVQISNNVYGGPGDTGCEAMLVGNPYEQLSIFNNLLWDLPANAPAFGQNGSLPSPTLNGTARMLNNTVVTRDGNACIRTSSGTMDLVHYRNNHCISSGSDPGTISATTSILTPNVLQTIVVANGQGYTNAQAYKYAPTDSGDATVGTGTNLTSLCTGALTALCYDTTYGVTRTATNTTTPGRTATARPTVGAWDIGAYQLSSTPPDTTPPARPTGVTITKMDRMHQGPR